MAANRGMVAIVSVGGHGREDPAAVPFGGREPLLHTNPIAVACPGENGTSMAFDFATTGVSGGKLGRYADSGEACRKGVWSTGTETPQGIPAPSTTGI